MQPMEATMQELKERLNALKEEESRTVLLETIARVEENIAKHLAQKALSELTTAHFQLDIIHRRLETVVAKEAARAIENDLANAKKTDG